MKIGFIGPGIMTIPPDGWGAVESLIWEIACELGEKGHEGMIINVPDLNEIVKTVKENDFDFIHLFYDVFHPVMDAINQVSPRSVTAISSAYPYVDQFEFHQRDGYTDTYNWLINQKDHYNFCLSDKDLETYKNGGADVSKLLRLGLGAQHKNFKFDVDCEKPDKTLYMAKIEVRKRQWIYQSIDSIEFVGRYSPTTTFDRLHKSYIGEWTTEEKHENVTKYANLMLLSDGENGTPLVIKEALVSGIGIVCSKYAAYDLDTSLPFITIIPDDKLNDLEYVESAIKENREASIGLREEIREYGVKNFSWETIVNQYEKDILEILK
jgi:glycosyltransferase involved in cell wall biosynthesis